MTKGSTSIEHFTIGFCACDYGYDGYDGYDGDAGQSRFAMPLSKLASFHPTFSSFSQKLACSPATFACSPATFSSSPATFACPSTFASSTNRKYFYVKNAKVVWNADCEPRANRETALDVKVRVKQCAWFACFQTPPPSTRLAIQLAIQLAGST